jgi:hypothetical protein
MFPARPFPTGMTDNIPSLDVAPGPGGAVALPAARTLGTFADGQAFLVQRGERVFKLSRGAHAILDGVSSGQDYQAIAERINADGATQLGARDVERIAQQLHARMDSTASIASKATQLWARVTLLTGAQLRGVLGMLAGVYESIWLFYLTFFLAVLGNGLWMVSTPIPTLSQHDLALTPLVLLCMVAISFLHEIAHAAAAYRFNSEPSGIGAGIFVGVPVLYADVTSIWCLRARERIVVNLAGVQAQLLANLPLAWLAGQVASPAARWTLVAVCWTNIGSAIVNLIPFAKLDGYWVLADAIGSPHLEHDANALLVDAARRMAGRASTMPRSRRALAVYALGQAVMYAVFAAWFVMALGHVVVALWRAPASAWDIASASPWQLGLLAFMTFKLCARVGSFFHRGHQHG